MLKKKIAIAVLLTVPAIAQSRAPGALRVDANVVASWRLSVIVQGATVQNGGTEVVRVPVHVDGETAIDVLAEIANRPGSRGCELTIDATTAVTIDGQTSVTVPWAASSRHVLASSSPADVYVGCRPL